MKQQAWIAAIVVAAGCGDNLPGAAVGTHPPPPIDALPPDLTELCGAIPVTFDDWEDCYQKRWCEALVGCSYQGSFRDVQECLDWNDKVMGGRLSAERRERKRAVAQGRASLDVAAFTQCLADTSGTLCQTVRSSVACATRFDGNIRDGDACYTDVECASPGATCESSCTDACCLGTCRPKLKQGQMCELGDSCEPGLVCHGVCLLGDIGAPCVNSRDCDLNAWCNTGRCVATLAPGSTCTSRAQCGSRTECVGLSLTEPTPGHCLSVSAAGDRCDFRCYGSLYCDASGICRELPELGQSCSGFIPCRRVDTFCSNGQCVLRGDAGTSCSSNQLCRPGLFCTSELNDAAPMCVSPGGEGQPCAAPGHCESYLCSGSADQIGVCLPWSETCPPDGT